MCLSNRLAVIK